MYLEIIACVHNEPLIWGSAISNHSTRSPYLTWPPKIRSYRIMCTCSNGSTKWIWIVSGSECRAQCDPLWMSRRNHRPVAGRKHPTTAGYWNMTVRQTCFRKSVDNGRFDFIFCNTFGYICITINRNQSSPFFIQLGPTFFRVIWDKNAREGLPCLSWPEISYIILIAN